MTIDEYIEAQKDEIKPLLKKVRKTIRKALPEAEERYSWSMPTWWQGKNLIHFAAMKNHLGLYPGPEAIEAFKDELDEKGLHYSKGAIRFPYDKIDLQLIEKIAGWCKEHI